MWSPRTQNDRMRFAGSVLQLKAIEHFAGSFGGSRAGESASVGITEIY
jgi:hypothetical protein